jgi:thiol-disulfide isomerase/thioredoxin
MTMLKRSALLSGLVLMLVLAACAPAAAPATQEAMMDKTSDTMMKETPDAMMDKTPEVMMEKTPDAMMKETPGAMMEKTPDAMMEKPAEAMMEMPAWFSASLTNAATGEAFTIQDFKGKVVLVETMAMWCPTCLRQQKEVQALHEQLGERDDFVSVGIDIDLNENIADLKDYTAKNGFAWTYTVATPDVAREIGNLYGQQFLNPPSAPMFIIDRHGAVHPLPFGVKSAADLQQALEPFLNEAM